MFNRFAKKKKETKTKGSLSSLFTVFTFTIIADFVQVSLLLLIASKGDNT